MGSEIYMIRAPLAKNNATIFGRNSLSFCCKEIVYFPAKSEGTIKVGGDFLFVF